jgi:hypothetical protein
MNWLAANWYWILLPLAMVAFHLFGHGGHGRHGSNRPRADDAGPIPLADDGPVPSANDQNQTHVH